MLGSAAVGARAAAQRGLFRRIWPHEDGRSWSYQAVERIWDSSFPTVHPTPEGVGALTLDAAAALLGVQPAGANPTTSAGQYGLRFNGTITTFSGVTKQKLEESSSAFGARSMAVAANAPAGGFRALLRRARPDLAAKLEAREAGAPRIANAGAALNPTLLFGYAWEQTEDWVASYGDLDQQVSWLYLTSSLSPGAEFSLQLIPDLADDVFLHARVLGWRSASTPAGTFHRALDVLYLVDFGVSQATDVGGNPLGFFRAYTYGTVTYVPGTGPIQSYERYLVEPGNPPSPGVGDLTLNLLETGAGPVARQALSSR